MSENRLNILKIAFDTTIEGIIVSDDSGNVVFANESIINYFGYAADELSGKSIELLIPKKFKKRHHTHYDSYLKEPSYLKDVNYREVIGLNKNGKEVPLEVRISSFFYDEKRYALAFVFDNSFRRQRDILINLEKRELQDKVKDNSIDLENTIKQLQKTNQLLREEIQKKIIAKEEVRKALMNEREVNQLKSKFLTLVSHEFRTPLSGIMTSATLIKKYTEKENIEGVVKHSDTISNMVKHLTNILDDFLSLDKIENADVLYKFTHFECIEVINSIVNETKSLLKKGQKIEIEPLEKAIELYQDKKIYHIIISNLLFNAIKYSPENSTIKLKIEHDGHFIQFIISDQGIGIPENEQKFIFQRFFRASNVSHIQGTGIGLNIIKVNIESLGGKIKFESIENQGTSFYVKLPTNIKLE
jgi:PAS domain S-box-containing protein